jgi:Mating-type protein MAT alpha 1 HMG-box
LLRQLWKAPDPFQTKWALIAKAYSIIRREQGRSLSNVKDFLAVTAPFMDMIPPEDYLEVLGYVLYEPHGEEGYTLVQEYLPNFNMSRLSSDKSILDIVKNAIDTGYVRMNADQIIEIACSHAVLMYQAGHGKFILIIYS